MSFFGYVMPYALASHCINGTVDGTSMSVNMHHMNPMQLTM